MNIRVIGPDPRTVKLAEKQARRWSEAARQLSRRDPSSDRTKRATVRAVEWSAVLDTLMSRADAAFADRFAPPEVSP